MKKRRFTRPCCGYRTLHDFPGSFEICKVCFWEDDPVQLLDPRYRGGANTLSLMKSQANLERLRVSDDRFVKKVRPPKTDESRDPEWRMVSKADLVQTRTSARLTDDEHQNLEVWYCWMKNAK